MTNIQVVGLGALNMDYIYQVEHLAGDRETAQAIPEYEESELKQLGVFPGGSAANTIFGLAKLGLKTGFVGVIGDDADGKVLVKDFQKIGVDTSQIKIKPGAKTGLARCLSDKLNFRSIRVTPGANSLLTRADIDLDYLNQAEMVHISSLVDDAQWEILLELVNKLDASVKISFSPGGLYAAKGIRTLAPILTKTGVLFVNESEIKQLTGEDFDSGARRCLDLGCHIVVVTLGKGVIYKSVMATSYIRTADKEYVIEPGNKSIVSASDTIGAGDAFATGFLYGLLNGKPPDECGRVGNIVAQFSIQEIGARDGLPTLSQLTKRYRKLYKKELAT